MEIKDTIQNRLRSPVVWAAVVAQVLSLLLTLGVIDTELSATVDMILAGVLQLLTIFGVLNNPTAKTHF